MRAPDLTPNFVGQRALVLHRAHGVVEAIARQLSQIGVAHEQCWPELPMDLDISRYHQLFFDADMGYDGQFPWAPGVAPLPSIALIGSEAPGRVAWAIRQGADAHLLKPVGSAGIYSALVIATSAFRQRAQLAADLSGLRQQLAGRQVLAEATAQVMQLKGCDAGVAYGLLREMAMNERMTIEAAAQRVLQIARGGDDRRSRA